MLIISCCSVDVRMHSLFMGNIRHNMHTGIRKLDLFLQTCLTRENDVHLHKPNLTINKLFNS